MAELEPSQADRPEPGLPGRDAMSLDQFMAFNDELAGLVRAGVPMEKTLRTLARDSSGSLGDVLQALAARLERGETLVRALAEERGRVPEFYRAVVEAGLRAGRLPVALEGVANYVRNYAEMRQTVGMALVYPLIVLLFAYGLLLFFIFELAPKFVAAYRLFRLPSEPLLDLFVGLRGTVVAWGPALPILVLVLGIWWARSRSVNWVGPAWSRRALASLPWIRGILANARTACFAELLSLLVENDVPLHQAIVLAGEASPDEKMARGAREIAGAIERGESAAAAVSDSKEFPPLLRWLLVAGLERGAWVQALRHASATYRELAQHQASMLRQVLPVVLLLAIGGTAVLIYGLSVFVPFSALLKDLSVF